MTTEEVNELWSNNVYKITIPKGNYIEMWTQFKQKEYHFFYQWNIFLQKPHLIRLDINGELYTKWMVLNNCWCINEAYREIYDLCWIVKTINGKEPQKSRESLGKDFNIYITDWETYDKIKDFLKNIDNAS